MATSAAIQGMSFEQAARQLHETLKPGWKNMKHGDQWINTLTTYVFPTIGTQQVADLKPADFAQVLTPIWLSKSETASRVKQRCHAVMKWCWGRELVSGNPVDIVDTLLPKQPSAGIRVQHHPSVPWRDIPAFFDRVLVGRDNVTKDRLEFVVLTAARSGEAREAMWDEVDLTKAVWSDPASRMKAGKAHRVPLSVKAVEILERRNKLSKGSALVFPAPRGGQLTDMVLTSFLRKHKAPSDVPGRTATAHGFRSSYRDWASENGYARDLAERALAHSIKNQAEAAYHRTDLLEQRRPMMDDWAKHVKKANKKHK